jgi:hypothetical protein
MPITEPTGQPAGPLSPAARGRALLICNGNFEHLNDRLASPAMDAENLTRIRGAGRQFGAGDGNHTRAATLEDLMAAGLLAYFSKKIWHSHCSSAKLVLAQ